MYVYIYIDIYIYIHIYRFSLKNLLTDFKFPGGKSLPLLPELFGGCVTFSQ